MWVLADPKAVKLNTELQCLFGRAHTALNRHLCGGGPHRDCFVVLQLHAVGSFVSMGLEKFFVDKNAEMVAVAHGLPCSVSAIWC